MDLRLYLDKVFNRFPIFHNQVPDQRYGCACIVVNGDVVAQGSQFSLKDVEVITSQVDLDAVASLRGSISSFQEQASCKVKVSSVYVPCRLTQSFNLKMTLSSPKKIMYHSPQEEIAFGPACWLWDYLRRSGASGFLLPLSGGADSSSVAAIVGCMCQLVVKEIANGDEQVKTDAKRIGNYTNGEFPTDSKEFAKRIFYTVFMGSENSSEATKMRAKQLADEIGAFHLDVCIDGVVAAVLTLFQTVTGMRPRYKVDGGSNVENLGLQNIQARMRMVLAFMLASLLPWVHSKPGFYLVLGSSNVDEGLRGYLTKGCDGGRLYYDGCACIVVNGDVVAQGSQFSLKDVEVITSQVDLDAVASLRGSISSFQEQASCKVKVSSVYVPCRLTQSFNLKMTLSSPKKIMYHSPQEEIAFGPACWLWDYLRRSGASGFLLPLSGGADSSSVAAIVGCMCQLVVKEIANGDEQVKTDAKRIGNYTNGEFPTDSKEFAKRIFYTVFMGSENSSEATKMRAKQLADEIGAWHLDVCIDGVVSAVLTLFQTVTGMRPRYKVDGGSNVENLGLQNIQARMRMVLAFMLASLLPWVHSKPGFYLVLGSSNVDEGLRGYLTKYDCSSADINPIGSISKQDLRLFLRWAATNLGYQSLAEIEAAPPVAFPGEEASYGKEVGVVAANSGDPSAGVLLLQSYSPEDNRFDLRQFLYNSKWPYQFKKIDEIVDGLNGDSVAFPGEEASYGKEVGVVAANSGDPSAGL
ncbi:hypothetical protein F2Q69_00010114 [Brassica cretica]|uniref:NAD(+) synthase (glutamine-hydrolyzing) n=1 Tax=Brassica cretica TaxID=69181 RepID=A0A8S9NPY7_BRACR|nr:hypothetical protein F2Q69_00010114 [Brassica cretica]